jgi:hypothetical protein
MVNRSAAAAEVTPVPEPASGEQPKSERRRIGDLIERHAHARSVAELPAELRDNPLIRDLVSMPPEEEERMRASLEAHREAEALYGDDAAAELAALEAGTHPLCRVVSTALPVRLRTQT